VPKTTLSAAELWRGWVDPPGVDAARELLAHAKAELVGATGDEWSVEATPDRLDLLCESGLRAYFDGVAGHHAGPVPLREGSPAFGTIEVEASVAPLRPYIAALTATPPTGSRGIEAGLLAEVIRFQELLHATIGFGRRTASLGVYPIRHIQPPLRYRLAPAASLTFTPLDGTTRTSAAEFYDAHPMAARYGEFGRAGDACLVLNDHAGTVLSLPPVLNSREAGEVVVGDGALLLEGTGTRAARVEEALGLLALPFAAHGYTLTPWTVKHPAAVAKEPTPLEPRTLPLTASAVSAVLGASVGATEIESALARSRLHAERRGDDGWRVHIPPWRPDLLGTIDLVEEVLLLRELHKEPAVIAPASTRGARQPARRLERRLSAELLGLGFVPLCTPVLVAEESVILLNRPEAVALANPVSREYARARDAVMISLAASLGRNVRHPYPQRIAEVGPVLARGKEGGATTTRHHAAFALAADGAGFAEAAAIVDGLLRSVSVVGVRAPAVLPGTVPGRAARLRVAGEVIAELGEFDPAVLEALHIPVPVVWGEIDLTALFPLVRAE
jgi:phenylalanyl-tRNA synthetase beta chain